MNSRAVIDVNARRAISPPSRALSIYKAALCACCGVALIVLMFALPLRAQVGTADVLGTITDPSGAVILKASVTIRNVNTGEIRNTTTNDRGDYLINTLPNGKYALTVAAQGFNTYTVMDISLSTDDRARYNITLAPGAVSENVQVSASVAPSLQTDSSTVTSTIEPKAMQNLPMANRNYYSIVQLLPGVSSGAAYGTTSGNGPATSGGSEYDRRPFSTIVANGQSDQENNHLVNGFDNNEVEFGNTGVRPTVDGIEEMKVESTNAPAEYGRAAGAVVNVVTKAGTNEFHGSLFEFLRNQKTDGRDYFDNVAGTNIAPYHQNNFGGSLGGPIKKDKTFFFFGIENDRINKGQTFVTKVPTKYEHDKLADGIGDFSDLCSDTAALGIGCTDYPILTGSQINQFMLKMYQLYPAPNDGEANGEGLYSWSPPYTQRILDWELRIDHHFSPKDIFFARYAYNPAKSVYPSKMPSVNGVAPVGDPFGLVGIGSTNTQNIQLDYVHILTDRLLLDFKAGYTRYNGTSKGPNEGKGFAQSFGMPNAPAKGAIGDDLPMIGSGAFPWTSVGGPNAQPYNNVENSYQYAISATYTLGAHQLKAGAGVIRRQAYIDLGTNAAGMIGCLKLVDCLEGYAGQFRRETPVYNNNYRGREWSAFAQDNWRLTTKTTLNLGVRYDIFTPYNDVHGYVSNFDSTSLTDGLTQDAHNFIVGGTGGVKMDYGAIAPRLGIVYSITPKTVIRGGFGLTYIGQGGIGNSSGNPPYYFSYAVSNPNLNDTTIWKNPTPSDLTTWNDNSAVTTLVASPKNAKNIRTYQTNMAMQREIGANSVTLAYVGVFGRKISNSVDLNKPNMPGAGNPPATYVYTKSGPGSITSPPGAPPWVVYDYGNPNGILNYVTEIDSYVYNGISNYNGMQAIYARQLTRGLSLNANWTWAHAQANTSGANNDQVYYGNSSEDIRHRVTLTGSYEVPFGKSFHGVAGILAKGWQLNTAFQWQTGSAFMIGAQASCDEKVDARCTGAMGEEYTLQPNQRHYYPDVVGKPYVNGHFNYAAFAPPAPGTNGNEGYNMLHGPHMRSDDLSASKTVQLTERIGLQFRAEAFNISNTPNFVETNTSVGAWTQGEVTSQNPSGLIASSSGSLGQITDTAGFSNPRRFQFALKLLF
jgi:hypothetical protein